MENYIYSIDNYVVVNLIGVFLKGKYVRVLRFFRGNFI